MDRRDFFAALAPTKLPPSISEVTNSKQTNALQLGSVSTTVHGGTTKLYIYCGGPPLVLL